MKKNKLLILLSIIIFSLNNLFAISFEYHIFETRTNMEFANGVFPTSLLYQFNFPIPELIPGQTTDINFRLDNGLDFRTIRQNPETGKLLIEEPLSHPIDYLTLYDEMNIVLGQGFLRNSLSNKDTLKIWTTVDLRFENAFESFDYLKDPSNIEGLFNKNPMSDKGPATPRYTTWIGQPELTGDRSTINLSLSLGFDVNYMEDKITRRNGVKNSFWIRLNPKWFDAFNDNTQDFILIWDKLDLAFTPFALKMNGSRDTTWLSLVLDNSTTFKFIKGAKVPYYVQGGYIFGAQAINTENIITNRTALTLYGPQINSYDCYPYISTFFDFGLSFGKLLNSNSSQSYFDFIYSIGGKAEFILFNIASIYCEIGYVFQNTLKQPSQPIFRFGFTFGV